MRHVPLPLAWLLCLLPFYPAQSGFAQEMPYFVTYSHHMEEPGSLELESKSAVGRPPNGNRFWGASTEFEYGTRGWWTTELYLDTALTAHQGAVFGGFRIENRFRPLMTEHRINPVVYVEFEDINAADKSLLEVVGHDGAADLAVESQAAHLEKLREAELKLILSSDLKGWNVSENLIFEKNLNNSPWEFGYAIGATRPLRLGASAGPCGFCPEDLALGLEMYGGLGDRYTPGLHDTSHYVAPIISWQRANGPRLSFSPGFGLNSNSLDHILRIGVAYEFGQVGLMLGKGGR